MDCIIWKIPGIRAIAAVNAVDLPADAVRYSEAGLPIIVATDATEVPFIGEAECSVTETHTRAGVKYDVRLTFTTADQLEIDRATGFVVIDHDGHATLIGQREAPAPRVTLTDTTGKLRDRRACSYEVAAITRPVGCSALLRM